MRNDLIRPSHPAVTITRPHAWELVVQRHELFKNLYWDLCTADAEDNWLNAGSFSSGQVAHPLGKDSKTYSWPSEKRAGAKARFSGESSSEIWSCSSFSAFLHFKPHHGIAMDALVVNRSNDLIVFAWSWTGSSCPIQFHIYTLESSPAETICFPSEVKHADSWFPDLRRPTERKEKILETNI